MPAFRCSQPSHACVSNSYKKIKYVLISFPYLADIKCKQTHILFIVRIVEGQSELLFQIDERNSTCQCTAMF